MMICEQWFPTPIWTGKFNNVNDIHYEEAVQYCLDCKENSPGQIISNVGGWHSNSFTFNNLQDTPLAVFLKIIDEHSKQAFTEIGISSAPPIDNIWININKKTDSNALHNHPNSSISGVFYLTQKNSAIVFNRDAGVPKYHLAWMRSKLNTPLSYTNVTYTPERGDFLLFPSWLEHLVNSSQTEEERISVSFNYCNT